MRSLFPSPTVYLIDTSSVLRLDGIDDLAPKDPFSDSERDAIWEGLKFLSADDRLKVIKQVKGELKRLYKRGLYKLSSFPNHELIMKKANVAKEYQDVTSKHPDLVPVLSHLDPADPWLIVASELFDYTIICEEYSKQERSKRLPRHRLDMERIPDVCSVRNLPCPIRLRDLAKQEGWIE